ncbi:hypothetical protein [Coraliomargarita parva]|uniref:hypothetical protein n=1 Tax=Coraliomargarita parva TaxID=3014050 RepID=UPI0022B38CB0|nr:hypothetical protein [Coraliomargarita parva]
MKLHPKHSICILLACSSLSAENILLNFGATSYNGTNAPGHSTGDLTGTYWNTVASDTASGIVDENGLATDIALDFGTSASNGSTTVNYSNATKSSDYTFNSAYDTFITLFDTGLGSSNAVRDTGTQLGIAVAVSGLDQGEYRFYVTTFRGDSDSNTQRDFDLYAGTSTDAMTDFSGSSIGTIINTRSGLSNWSEVDNYLTGTFTIDGTNDVFSILSDSPSYIGVLTSLEIVAVPEPAQYTLIFSAIAVLLLGYRRTQKLDN